MHFSVDFALISILLTSCLCMTVVESYKFLAVLHTSARSHFIVGSALMKASLCDLTISTKVSDRKLS